MSAEAAYLHFIKPVTEAFREPPGSDAEAFFASLSAELAGFSSYQLGAGARQIKRERTSRTFPTIAECIGACERWPVSEPTKPQEESGRAVSDDDASHIRRRHAFAILRGDAAFARQASKEGWLGQIYDYAVEHGRLPPPEAAGRLCAQAERVREQLSAVGGALGLGLIDAYRTRYKSIQQVVFGGEKE